MQGGVAPFTGAWIEMEIIVKQKVGQHPVAPFTGAWIEILICYVLINFAS